MTPHRSELGKPRIYVERTTSTMDEVISRATLAPEGLTVISGEQTQGRGRAGREWHAPLGSGLLFSTLLRPDCSIESFQVFPLLAGLAVAEAIESASGTRVQVKWPNDLLIEKRKVAGLLVTSNVTNGGVEQAILGVGINIYRVQGHPDRRAISIEEATNRSPDLRALLDEAMKSLSAVYAQFLAGNGQVLLDRWLARAAYLGQKVDIVDDCQRYSGRFTGVTSRGALILQSESGAFREVHSGDLVRGPVPASNVRQ